MELIARGHMEGGPLRDCQDKGYDMPNTNNRHRGELKKRVVLDIAQLLKKNDFVVTSNLVGIEPHRRGYEKAWCHLC